MNVEPASVGAKVRLGEQAPILAIGSLGLTDVVRFAGATGDLNPVHHDPEFARSLGHPDVFIMGMLPGAILAEFAARWLAPLRVRFLDLRFVDRVWTDEPLECGGEVIRVDDRAIREVTVKLWVRTTDGVLKISGDCTVSSRWNGTA